MRYRTLDPSSGELIREYPLASPSEIRRALETATETFETWRATSSEDRRALLYTIAEVLEDRSEPLAELMALEMGKPLAQGRSEAEKCAWVCRHYAKEAEALLKPRPVESDGSEAWVHHYPLGPIFAIMPWNFPLWQVFRFVAPAIAAGNVALLKHAPSTPGCALAIVDGIRAAGAPEGLLQTLFLSDGQAAEVIADPGIRGVTLTGSTGAGREVAAAAGRALKPMVLELGGSDPFIVFDDADLERAVAVGVQSRCLNSGQSCIAAKRFLVADAIYDRFAERFVDAMADQQVRPATHPECDLGPLARADLRDGLHQQVEAAIDVGATRLLGGEIPEGPGFFYPPTVLSGLDPTMEIAREEFFGPVATLYPFADEDAAVALANGTAFGLGASLWTADRGRVERIVPRLDVGSIFVNGLVKSDPRLPFGGVKDSGFGRELAEAGLVAFTNQKTIWLDLPKPQARFSSRG